MTRMRAAASVLAVAATAACVRPPARVETATAPVRAPATIRVQVADREATAVRTIRLEDYVRATIVTEFAPAGGNPADVEGMLEVQAVISRTYALANRGRHAREGFDLCATTHCQLYDPARVKTSRWAAVAAAAVTRTTATVLWFGGAPANAVFHADCGGHTSDAAAVWGGRSLPYLKAAADDGPAAGAHAGWRIEIARDAVRRALNEDPRTAVGGRLDDVRVIDRDASGRATRVEVRGAVRQTVRADVLREVLSRRFGARSIRSTRFEVTARGGTLRFSGLGFGHGVGLCQAGALARIRAGAAVRDVLGRYYPGAALVRLGRG